ncbi:MAG: cell division protein FtsA [Rhodothermales bacterium]|jgi:cell division protein FtsA
MSNKISTYTAIELGTSAIKVLMAVPETETTLRIIGSHEVPTGPKVMKGEITELTGMVDLLTEALNEVESEARRPIERVALAVTGDHIASVNHRARIPINGSDRRITEMDVDLVTRQAHSRGVPLNKREVYACHRAYLVDGDRQVAEPVGMVASQLTALVHVAYGQDARLLTAEELVNDVIARPPDDITFSGIAAYHGVGVDSSAGVLVIDIGAGVTEYAVFFDGGCMLSGQFTVGSDHLANDLSLGLGLPMPKCRDLILKYGCALRHTKSRNIRVEMPAGHPPREFKELTLQTIVEVRLRELFELIRTELERHEVLGHVAGGVWLCGGCAQISEIDALAKSVFRSPVTVGIPGHVIGPDVVVNSPRYVTPVGLLQLSWASEMMEMDDSPSGWDTLRSEVSGFFKLAKRAIRI